MNRFQRLSLLSVVMFMAVSVFAETTKAPSLAGQWKVEAAIVSGANKGKPAASTLALAEFGKVIVGEWGNTWLLGEQQGDTVTLRARSDSTSADLSLTMSGPDLMKGTVTAIFVGHGRSFEVQNVTMTRTSNDVPKELLARGGTFDEAAYKRLHAVKVVKRDLTPGLARKPTIPRKLPKGIAEDSGFDGVMDEICNDVVGWFLGAATEEIFVPMAPCQPSHDGAGYYLFGSQGPGARFIFTTTVYYPWEDVVGNYTSCPSREYDFTFSFTGDTMIGVVLEFLKDAQNDPIFSWINQVLGGGLSDLLTAISNLYNQLGDFAVFLGWSTYTGSLNLYIVSGSGDCGNISTDPTVAAIVGLIQDALGGATVNIMPCGNPVTDKYSLGRNNNVYSPIECPIEPIFFFYLFGTKSVQFN